MKRILSFVETLSFRFRKKCNSVYVQVSKYVMVIEAYPSHIGFKERAACITVEVKSGPKRSNGTIYRQVNSLRIPRYSFRGIHHSKAK